ncbi:MAG: PTS sugar transporter subunit IIA [Spirochaetales bacterium]|nr:PTS sugar transporter subunit IIA [Spirochaetales bacterium]
MSYFKTGTVENLDTNTKFKAIRELINKTSVFSHVKNIQKLEKVVIEREKIQSTGIGHGIAIAHGRTDEVEHMMMVLGISRRGIEYGSCDNNPVHFLFLIVNPPDKQDDYLHALSSIAKIAGNKSFRDELLALSSPRKIEKVLNQALSLCLDHRPKKNDRLTLQPV